MAETDDDDPVVEEIEVFLCPTISGVSGQQEDEVPQNTLMLLHCPDGITPIEDGSNYDCLTARVKPGHRVELELAPRACDSTSLHIDKSKARVLGRTSNDSVGPKKDWDRLTLGGNLQPAPQDSSLTVGVIRDGALYLNPVSHIATLAPIFSYLDSTDDTLGSPKRKGFQQPQTSAAGDTTGGESSQDEGPPEGAELVRVRYTRVESAEAKQRRLGSYDYFLRKQASQTWVNCTCHKSKDPVTAEVEATLLAPNPQLISPVIDFTTETYAASILPPPSELSKPELIKQPEISMNRIRELPPAEQIRALLRNVKVIQFQQLIPLLPRSLSQAQIFATLQECAVLVQGCWVAKSEELYPPNSSSPISGAPAEALINGRDFILWCFTQSRWLMRKDVVPIIRIPAEDVKVIFEQVARPTARKGWEFILPLDHNFLSRHLEACQRQFSQWDARFQALQTIFKVPRDWEKRAKALHLQQQAESAAVSTSQAGGVADSGGGVTSPSKRKRTKSKSGGPTP